MSEKEGARYVVWGKDPEPEDPTSPPWEVVLIDPNREPSTVEWCHTEKEAQDYCDEMNKEISGSALSKRSLALQATTKALGGILDAIEPKDGESGSSWAWAVFGEGDREWLHTDMQRELHDTICAEYWAVESEIAKRG